MIVGNHLSLAATGAHGKSVKVLVSAEDLVMLAGQAQSVHELEVLLVGWSKRAEEQINRRRKAERAQAKAKVQASAA